MWTRVRDDGALGGGEDQGNQGSNTDSKSGSPIPSSYPEPRVGVGGPVTGRVVRDQRRSRRPLDGRKTEGLGGPVEPRGRGGGGRVKGCSDSGVRWPTTTDEVVHVEFGPCRVRDTPEPVWWTGPL